MFEREAYNRLLGEIEWTERALADAQAYGHTLPALRLALDLRQLRREEHAAYVAMVKAEAVERMALAAEKRTTPR